MAGERDQLHRWEAAECAGMIEAIEYRWCPVLPQPLPSPLLPFSQQSEVLSTHLLLFLLYLVRDLA